MDILKTILKMAKKEQKSIDALCKGFNHKYDCTEEEFGKLNFKLGKARAFNQILKEIGKENI
tara:strand:- start:49 stop:234 length:186 start_codon:yes stop_codon:yes gene_type:complete